MPAEIEPDELARIVDFTERSRVGDWSLRSALVRYAEGQPERVSRVLESVRRLDAALHPHRKVLERRGPELWSAVDGGASVTEDAPLLDLLRVAIELDRLGDTMAEWADDRTGPWPDDTVDDIAGTVASRLDELGVPREEQQSRRSGRGV